MNKQTNRRGQTILPTTIAIIILLSAASSTFAQKSLNAKYPPPDFSAMADY